MTDDAAKADSEFGMDNIEDEETPNLFQENPGVSVPTSSTVSVSEQEFQHHFFCHINSFYFVFLTLHFWFSCILCEHEPHRGVPLPRQRATGWGQAKCSASARFCGD